MQYVGGLEMVSRVVYITSAQVAFVGSSVASVETAREMICSGECSDWV